MPMLISFGLLASWEITTESFRAEKAVKKAHNRLSLFLHSSNVLTNAEKSEKNVYWIRISLIVKVRTTNYLLREPLLAL